MTARKPMTVPATEAELEAIALDEASCRVLIENAEAGLLRAAAGQEDLGVASQAFRNYGAGKLAASKRLVELSRRRAELDMSTKGLTQLESYAWWKANEAEIRDRLVAKHGEQALIEAVGEAFRTKIKGPPGGG
jgi:hypothetical protein